MRFVTKLLPLVVLLSAATAEITMPKPPTPPKPPQVVGAKSFDTSDPDQLVTTIGQIDSLRARASVLQAELKRLGERETELVDQLPPASRRTNVYTQSEVDRQAVPIRRFLPALAESGNLEVSFVVNPDGYPTKIRVVSGPIGQNEVLVDAVGSWLYAPAIRSGRRVPVRLTTTVRLSEK